MATLVFEKVFNAQNSLLFGIEIISKSKEVPWKQVVIALGKIGIRIFIKPQ